MSRSDFMWYAPVYLGAALLVGVLVAACVPTTKAAAPSACVVTEGNALRRCVFPDAVCYYHYNGGVSCRFDPPSR